MAEFIQPGGWGTQVPAGLKAYYSFDNSTAIHVLGSYGLNMVMDVTGDIELGDYPFVAYVVATYPLVDALTGVLGLMPGQLTDYRFRFWVIPNLLNLSNPTLGANIPFKLWNTFPATGTVTAVNVVGSSVLTFDYGIGNTIAPNEYRTVNLQINAGEPTIDADISFVHGTLGVAFLELLAIVAETFPILPETPVSETWEFKTDILTNYNGIETRMSLMPEPRINLDFNVRVVDFAERQVLYQLTSSNIKVASVVPMYQYSAPVTALTVVGSDRLYFDPALCNARVGRNLIVINRASSNVQLGTVTALHVDGATINAAVGVDIEPNGLWFVLPALLSFLKDDSGLDFGTQAGTYALNAMSMEEWTLQRPSSGVTITTFDSLPIVERPFLITTPERFAYRREVLDGGVGAQAIRSRDTNFVVKRSVKFSVDRGATSDMDYWREFFTLVRGAQKPFLLSTQLPDLTLRLAHGDGVAVLDIAEQYYEAKLFPLDAFKRLQITYTDGTISNHVVGASSTDVFSNTQITIIPSTTPTKTISRISFLQKVRGSDTISLEHYNDYSYIKFGVRTTNT